MSEAKELLRKEIEAGLSNFYGTMQYHEIVMGPLKATDGIVWFCKKAKCYWLMDIVSSYQSLLKKMGKEEFQIWTIEQSEDGGAVVYVRSDSGPECKRLVSQELEYADFPLEQFEFYVDNGVILLKSEY